MAYVFAWEDGERLEMTGGDLPRGWRILVDPRNTGSGHLSMGNQDIPAGGGIPVHRHEKEEEILFIHEGRAEIEIDGRRFAARAGTTAFLPVNVPHGLRNSGDGPLRLVWVFSPPGYESVFREMAARNLDHGAIEDRLGLGRP